MTGYEATAVIANIRSNPRMSRADEQSAVEALFDWAKNIDADFVFGCEIDHPSLRRIWRRVGRAHGFATYGTRKGSENTVSIRKSRWTGRLSGIRFLSKGVSGITPRRTITEVLAKSKHFYGPDVECMSTHLVSRWQSYAKSYTSKWSLRGTLARASINRAEKRIDRAQALGRVALLGGDMNALTNLQFDEEQVQLVGVHAKARGNLGKMMQLVAVAPPGWKVIRTGTYTKPPVATDHPYRAASFKVVSK